MALASGTKIGPYEIHSSLGAGGMGEVYRATDTKLGRDVALKVLPSEMAHDAERLARFRREAKALAQLDHPNIVTIYSVEECDGVHFLTMQLVEGQTLDRVIPQGGLPAEQIVEIAGALGDALAAAHEKGIIHRDLKPANVMVSSDGRVKVLDFGLAKDFRVANVGDATLTSASQTQMGVVMGTPAYMSPEQTSGRPLDHRTDIFSLGVVLHEMATGRRPFDGNSSAELVSAILRDTPPAVTVARPDLPSDLARIIRRCLEKDARHRVQTARDVSNEFRDLVRQTTSQRLAPATASTTNAQATSAGGSGAVPAEDGFWVAVLPFKYSGGSAELTALAEGLTEDVVTGLSRFPYLKVIARSSTSHYADRAVDVRTAGKELGARYVMEGSLRQAGTRLRVAVQLVDSVSGAHLWAENYERNFDPEAVFQLQDDLVPRIVSTIADGYGVLPYGMSELVRGKDPEQLSPHETLLRCMGYAYRISPEEHAAARTFMERVVKHLPGYADGWAMLSQLYADEYGFGFNAQPDPLGRALQAARRAADLAPSNSSAQNALAKTLFFRKEFPAFRAAAEQAISLNPMDGAKLANLGGLVAYAGEWEKGCALVERAAQLNPRHPGWYWFPLCYNAYRKGDYRGALDIANKINMPGFFATYETLAAVYGQLGERDAASQSLAEMLKLIPNFGKIGRALKSQWFAPEMVEHVLDGLRKAGLEIADNPETSVAVKAADSGASRADEGFWVAVLPFKFKGSDPGLEVLADGLTEGIIAGLSRFSYLRVIGRGSTTKYSGESGDVRAIGKELGARYVMEGTLRQAGAKLRLAIQLVDAVSGAHLWAQNYERAFHPDASFELQDDLVPRIVSTIADTHGVLPYSMHQTLRNRNPDELTPYEALLRGFAYFKHVNDKDHAGARAALEKAVQQVPGNADCLAMLSMLYREEYNHGFNVRPDPLGRALAAARRAVDSAPSNHLAHHALASVLFFRHEPAAFRSAAQRAIDLNPMDGFTIGYMGFLLSFSGDWERGCTLMEQARDLNPNHPGWYWFPPFFNAYRQGDYRAALEFALKVNMPGFWRNELALAATYGQLGERELASNAAKNLLAARPGFEAMAKEECAKWWDPDLVRQILDGLRKAGLEIAPEKEMSSGALESSLASATPSGAVRAEDGFWVAVLPFKYAGASAELKALAEGLSEDIVTGWSRFSYLRVIARSSTAKYSNESMDIRAIGKELGARYVLEGSLRQAGTKLRLAVQLVDAVSGAHLWAETYERAFSPDSLFELQDDLVPRIVSTVADMNGMLPRSMSDAVRSRPPEQLSPYEAVLRSFCYSARATPEELVAARSALEIAVEKAPAYGDAWASLAILQVQDYAQGFNTQPDSLASGLTAARRAVEAAPSSHMSHCSLAQALYFHKELQSFRNAANRAVELNPMDGTSMALLGELLTYAGDWERGLALGARSKQLNPNHPGWYWYGDFYNAYRQGDYAGALNFALKVNLPGHWFQHAAMAAAYGQLGEKDAAGRALRDLLKLRPDFAATVRRVIEKWWSPEYAERVIDGLRKAGLEISGASG